MKYFDHTENNNMEKTGSGVTVGELLKYRGGSEKWQRGLDKANRGKWTHMGEKKQGAFRTCEPALKGEQAGWVRKGENINKAEKSQNRLIDW